MKKINIPANATWAQSGVTIAGGHGEGGATNQLNEPLGLFVDNVQTVVIADQWNGRIMQWKNGDTTNGQVVAGGKGQGNGVHQLNKKHEVRRYQLGEKNGTLAVGGNGKGDGLSQFNLPTYPFVDRDHSVYVSDHYNHRVTKWNKGAKEGIVIAGGQDNESALTQLYYPNGLFVDTLGTLYVPDHMNHCVLRWTQGDKKQGTVIVGGDRKGAGAYQFQYPRGLSFDRHGNLYVADHYNYRVQRFSIE
ncbi:unnamed protein product [Rotaria socialis]|uniref:Uncharacterized protein n=1 Tax=Rotaria socialis TaxID=392032 RepID=A0A817YWQ5_9BILA|nr:unnamed protein product [Rotaria socialis]